MHAIQRYHYDRLQGYLQRLQLESEIFQLPDDHLNTIVQQEKKLQQLYSNYQATLQQVAVLIKQYDQEHKSVRQLIISHKQYRKRLGEKVISIENV
ncbi:MAG: hypothetical protein H7Y86_14670 [Rhizobacter sp.]|nr:hypothetical protein [Ferruginibacter sp.]